MKELPSPSKSEVEKYLQKWTKLDNYVQQEEALNKLFFDVFPKNEEINEILIKVSTLNDFYSTNIFSPFSVARHIKKIDVDDKLRKGSPELVNEIAKVTVNDKEKNFYSFATKYCSHHNPKDFPIYDSYVEKVLMYFKRKENFAEFTKKDLKDYKRFKEIINAFRKKYGLDEYELKEIDRYLWGLGREFFPKKYKKNKK